MPWSPETTLPSAQQVVNIAMQGREVSICAWRFDVVGAAGHIIPVFLLDTDMEGNDPYDRRLTDHLYGGDTYYRLCQETVLGLGGVALLRALGVNPDVYHMNEGHAALLGIGLLEERLAGSPLEQATEEDVAAIAKCCVFTTHTPVPAGHDQFGLDQMYTVLGQERGNTIERFGCLHNGLLNMTYLGAALLPLRQRRRHAARQGLAADVPRLPRPLHHQRRPCRNLAVASHCRRCWMLRSPMAARQPLLPLDLRRPAGQDRELPRTSQAAPLRRSRPALRAAVQPQDADPRLRPPRRDLQARQPALHDPKRLAKLAKKIGGLQILFAGKAHPADIAGKGLIRDVFESAASLKASGIRILYLENYDWELGAPAHPGRRRLGQYAAPSL